jgi:ubiquinone/menaquinone biosynthesis C-methylase UbiE
MTAKMAMPTETSRLPYALGSTDAEHDRLIRQAAIFNPVTERLLREAGVGSGQRVLDIGSGLGDVSMLVARLVGPSGKVVGVDNDASTLAKAQDRVVKAGLQNVSFIDSNIDRFPGGEPFDAIVGRLILMYVPDPSAVIESLAKSLRPGGVLAIQDACWGPLLQLSTKLPLRSKCAALIYQAFQRSGANMEMECVLYRAFQGAGLPSPALRLEVPAGAEPGLARWVYEIFCSLLPRMQQHNLPLAEVGEIDTLEARLDAELASARMFGATIGLIGAWSRKAGLADPNRVE